MHRFWIAVLSFGVACSYWLVSPASRADEPGKKIDYEKQIKPVVERKCLRCHNPKKKEGKLDMSTRAAMLKGGSSGPAFVPGDTEKSLMLELIEFEEMPPKKETPRVTKQELETLTAWIAAGAPVPREK